MSGNPIEYSVVCIDNSDYMRNEDIRPNRFLIEKDAANIICHHILTSRPENRAAIVTLADTPQVIQSLTNNEINVLRKLYAIELKGNIDLMTALKVSILALKQISSKGLVIANIKRRIIAFIGSPLKGDQRQLDSLATKLNKSKISVDFITFGSENTNNDHILKSFVGKLKDSNLVNVPNDRVMANLLAESPILSHNREVSLVNENTDPELALAMKLSVADHKQHLDSEMRKAMDESSQTSSDLSSEDDDDLQKAIQMSLNSPTKSLEKTQFKRQSKTEPKIKTKTNTESKGLTEEEQLALTLQMSLLESQKQPKTKKVSKSQSKKTKSRKSQNKEKRNKKKH